MKQLRKHGDIILRYNKYILVLLLCLFCSGCFSGKKVFEDLSNGGETLIDDAGNVITKGSESSSETGTTTGQAWWFFILGGVLIICAVVSMACKELVLAVSCGVGAIAMCIMPSIIEAVHAALQGFIWFFYGLLIVAFLSIVSWAVYRVFHHVPEKKRREIREDLSGVEVQGVTTEETEQKAG